jgi:hypothetical protein
MVSVTHWAGRNIKDDLRAVEEGFSRLPLSACDGRSWRDLDDEEKVLQHVKILQQKFDVMVSRPRSSPGLVAIYLDDLGRMFQTR